MGFGGRLSLLCPLLTTLFAVTSGEGLANLRERSSDIVERQTCKTPGWIPACPGLFACVPPGAICCDDGFTYVMPPDSCPEGSNPVATATTITAAPSASTETIINYVWYTATFTWYYWYYYYTYIVVDQATVLTSSQVVSVTTVSVSATDSVQASALFSSLSATYAFPTPTQQTTSLVGTVAPTKSSVSNTTASAPTATPTFVTAAGVRAEPKAAWNALSWAICLTLLVPGIFMVLL